MEELMAGMFVWSYTLGDAVLVLHVPDDLDLDMVEVEDRAGTPHELSVDDLLPCDEEF